MSSFLEPSDIPVMSFTTCASSTTYLIALRSLLARRKLRRTAFHLLLALTGGTAIGYMLRGLKLYLCTLVEGLLCLALDCLLRVQDGA